NIRRRITIPLTLSNLKLLRRITRTENILHRNFTRRQVAIQNRVASNKIGRASCRERVEIAVVAVSLKKKTAIGLVGRPARSIASLSRFVQEDARLQREQETGAAWVPS